MDKTVLVEADLETGLIFVRSLQAAGLPIAVAAGSSSLVRLSGDFISRLPMSRNTGPSRLIDLSTSWPID